ncbi:Na/Pi-cotransporter II-like protein [gut metagenome]|uniref:Na/Pi-cotransporter II-like protein n=1 Tax=gut metagenome TaxID=749906 RepID=J9FQ69_9ZZZZ
MMYIFLTKLSRSYVPWAKRCFWPAVVPWKLWRKTIKRLLLTQSVSAVRLRLTKKRCDKNHIVRLNEKRCDPVAGFVMLELLINMKRVSDHSKNIGQLVQGTF